MKIFFSYYHQKYYNNFYYFLQVFFIKKKSTLVDYNFKWWLGPGSNQRHTDFQSVALPTELPSQMAVPTRLELAISSVTDWHVNHYTMGPFFGCGGRIWTNDLRVMSPMSYHCSTPRSKKNGGERGIRTPAAVTPCRFSRPIPSARLGYFSVYKYYIWWTF